MRNNAKTNFSAPEFAAKIDNTETLIREFLSCELQLDVRMEVSALDDLPVNDNEKRQLAFKLLNKHVEGFDNHQSFYVKACNAYAFYSKKTDMVENSNSRPKYIAEFYKNYLGLGIEQKDLDGIEEVTEEATKLEIKKEFAIEFFKTNFNQKNGKPAFKRKKEPTARWYDTTSLKGRQTMNILFEYLNETYITIELNKFEKVLSGNENNETINWSEEHSSRILAWLYDQLIFRGFIKTTGDKWEALKTIFSYSGLNEAGNVSQINQGKRTLPEDEKIETLIKKMLKARDA